ncbi:hypothetical protein [Bacillus weihaiensis]|uniref:DUF4181 domain-containing protein n=1 Tax=Bacillus weihaiensis TaxID=1547283 RepID=A0A1L3MUJ5_9BACI|nr:hypothetical protein [Bacillus weihaiensis]APH06012.1 hypothetical protein A9C19_15405 [Bacillus weihaiensis]
MKKTQCNTWIFLVFGALGLALVGFGGVMFIEIHHTKGYLTVVFALIITSIYIEYLERKAGISKKMIWIRGGVSILILIILTFFFFV